MPSTDTKSVFNNPDRQHTRKAAVFGIINQRLVNAETGAFRQKAEAGINVLPLQIALHIGDQPDHRQHQRLQKHITAQQF